MPRHRPYLALAAVLVALGCGAARATPPCLKDQTPFALADDVMRWTMSLAPGAECIQGLRWSYMQIYEVEVAAAPRAGKLVIVGPGFRYTANAEGAAQGQEPDRFTLLVSGKNRHTIGKSTIEITVDRARAMAQTVSSLHAPGLRESF